MAELILSGRVLYMEQTKKGWFRLIVQGRARFNEVLLLSPEQAVACGARVGEDVSLAVGPSVERDAQGAPTAGIVYFGRDGQSATRTGVLEKGSKGAA